MIENNNIQEFDKWNEVKKNINEENTIVGFKQRDIFNTKIGKNIGFEQNGKGRDFVRPVLVYKKLTRNMFIGIPLTTTLRNGNFFYKFKFIKNKTSVAILPQAKLFSSKRLLNKIGKINSEDFKKLKSQYLELLK